MARILDCVRTFPSIGGLFHLHGEQFDTEGGCTSQLVPQEVRRLSNRKEMGGHSPGRLMRRNLVLCVADLSNCHSFFFIVIYGRKEMTRL